MANKNIFKMYTYINNIGNLKFFYEWTQYKPTHKSSNFFLPWRFYSEGIMWIHSWPKYKFNQMFSSERLVKHMQEEFHSWYENILGFHSAMTEYVWDIQNLKGDYIT